MRADNVRDPDALSVGRDMLVRNDMLAPFSSGLALLLLETGPGGAMKTLIRLSNTLTGIGSKY